MESISFRNKIKKIKPATQMEWGLPAVPLLRSGPMASGHRSPFRGITLCPR